MKRFVLIVMSLFFLVGVNIAQFTTPTIDGTISLNEYGNHVEDQNQKSIDDRTWYVTWNNTDFFVGVSGYTNSNNTIDIYIDVDVVVPVNGGTNLDGSLTGTGNNGVTPNLPVRTDFFLSIKSDYDAYELADGNNSWRPKTENTITKSYSNNNNVIEFKIPWSVITGNNRPADFNWLGFLSYQSSGGGTLSRVPTENPSGITPDMVRYYTVSSTNDGSSIKPFSQNSYTHIGADTASFGPIDVFDFTMNSDVKTITRADGDGGQWNIANNLVLTKGTIDFGSSLDKAVVGGDVSISSGSTLSLSTAVGGNMEVAGSFTDNGTFTDNERLVLFNGSSLQTINGSSTTTFGYFTIAANAQVEIESNKNVTVDNDFTVNALKNGKAAGKITLKSDAISTGSLIAIGTVSGEINVQRFLTAGWDWHFLSSPVENQPIVGAYNFIGFTFGTGSNEGDPDVDFFRYDETLSAANSPWINIKDTDGTLNESFGTPSGTPLMEEGLGYLVAYNGSDLTKTFTGIPNTAIISNILSYTEDGSKGWNLVGNPYSCAADWEHGSNFKTNLASAFYYLFNQDLNGGGGGFEYFATSINSGENSDNVNGKIASGQAFMVKVASGGGMFAFSPYAREHNNQAFLKNKLQYNNVLKLKIQGEAYYSHAKISISDNGTVGADYYDAYMLFSMNQQVPHIYCIDGNEKMVMNSVPFPDEDYSLPLGIKVGSAGTYTITASDIVNFNHSCAALLEDTETGITINLRESNTYTFTTSENGIINSRFVMHLKSTVGIDEVLDKPKLVVTQINNTLHFYNLQPGNYNVWIVDIVGRIISRGILNADNNFTLAPNIQYGVYIVQVEGEKDNWMEKVIIR